MHKISNHSTVISNTENEPFLLPIDIGQYGQFLHDELEIRVCNDFIEVSGEQDWRMAAGGANKRMFAQRHVLPNYIDLKAIYCRLLDSKTILVSAPSLSFISRLTNSNQLKVDYLLGLDSKGLQFVKRYNSTANSVSPTIKPRASKERINQIAKTEAESVTNMLFDLVKDPTKSGSNSKLFSSAMGQQNINFVNNLKSNALKASRHKVHLNIEQLMQDKKNESKKLLEKSKAAVLEVDSKESASQTTSKKMRKRRSRKKKSIDQSMNSVVSTSDDKKENISQVSKVDTVESDVTSINASDKGESSKSSQKKFSPRRKKDSSTSSTGKRKVSESSSGEEKKKVESSSNNVDKKDWAIIKRDDFVKASTVMDPVISIESNEQSREEPKEEIKEKAKEETKEKAKEESEDELPSSSDLTEKNQTKEENKPSRSIIGSYISNLFAGNNLISSTSTTDQPLTSCLKDSNNDDKNESKKEKHVVIAESSKKE